jgi:hypothetical protein
MATIFNPLLLIGFLKELFLRQIIRASFAA